MPLENFQKISSRNKKQKSQIEKSTERKTVQDRVRAIMKHEKTESHNKIVGETRMKLKELFSDIKTKNTPSKKTRSGKGWESKTDWTYKGIGGKAVKTEDGTEKMKVFGLKFGNGNGEIALGAMHESQQDMPWGESRGTLGAGIIGTIKF